MADIDRYTAQREKGYLEGGEIATCYRFCDTGRIQRGAPMKLKFAFVLSLCAVLSAQNQRTPRPPAADPDGVDSALRGTNQTMKQLARGTQYAAASMMPQATLTAEHVLRAGGNAFDAI